MYLSAGGGQEITHLLSQKYPSQKLCAQRYKQVKIYYLKVCRESVLAYIYNIFHFKAPSQAVFSLRFTQHTAHMADCTQYHVIFPS